jgi:WD40 repeat protein
MLPQVRSILTTLKTTSSNIPAAARLKELSHVPSARFDSDELQGQVESCLSGTRVTLLAELDTWAASPDSASLLWLNGLAGTGKSTVARSFCERVLERKEPDIVLATFFVSHQLTEHRKAKNILHSFVYQLAHCITSYRDSVTQILAEEPDLLSRPLSMQVGKLMGSLKYSDPVILVLDALDECDRNHLGHEGGKLLQLLAQSFHMLGGHVKLLVTSRDESTIHNIFDDIRASALTSRVLQLHDIDHGVVRSDIRRFLVHSFKALKPRVEVADWPSQSQITSLLDRANVLFVYAATVVRYVESEWFDPRKRLEQVLSRTSTSSLTKLDELYRLVLRNAIAGSDHEQGDEPNIISRLRMMLAAVILAKERLSPSTIAGLFEWTVYETKFTLGQLSAIFILDNDLPVRIFHESFPEFMRDSSRCVGGLHLDDRHQHYVLARHSIMLMNKMLRKDILKTGLNPLIENSAIQDLQHRLQRHVPRHLRYAVLFWMWHLMQSEVDDDLVTALDTFCQEHLFHWLECLSYLEEIETALSDLEMITDHADVRDIYHADTVDAQLTASSTQISPLSRELLENIHHVTLEYYTAIRTSAAHIYHSALVTLPSCRLYDLSPHDSGDFCLRSQRKSAFNFEITYMEGHISSLTAFALSLDGAQLSCFQSFPISKYHLGTPRSGRMRVLQPPTDQYVNSFQRALALHFSRDGHQLFSANDRGHIYIAELNDDDQWTHLPPEAAEDLQHLDFGDAAFSAAGDYCVFVQELRLGDHVQTSRASFLVLRRVQAGARLHVIYHSNTDKPSSDAVFTPDSQYVVQAYGDHIVVCDVALCNQPVKIASGDFVPGPQHQIKALTAVSNTVCASMTVDGAVTLWDVVRGYQLRTLCCGKGKTMLRNFGLASSHDGYLLAVLADGTVRVFEIAGETVIAERSFIHYRAIFGLHVRVALDADNSRVYVSGLGEPLLYWNFNQSFESRQTPNTVPSAVKCLSLSVDGQFLVASAKDGTTSLWQTDTGNQIARYTGDASVAALALSQPSPKFVISTRVKNTPAYNLWLQVMAIETGEIIFDGRALDKYYSVSAVALSPDGNYLAIQLYFDATETGVVLIMNAQTGDVFARSRDFGSGRFSTLLYTTDGLALMQTLFDNDDYVDPSRHASSILIRNPETLEVRHTLPCEYSLLDANIIIPSWITNCVGHLHIARGSRLVTLCIWNIESGLLIHEQIIDHRIAPTFRFDLLTHIWTPHHLIYATSEAVVCCALNAQTPAVVHIWPEAWRTRAACSSKDGSHIYAWGEDGIIRGWTSADFEMEAPFLQTSTSDLAWPDNSTGWTAQLIVSLSTNLLRAQVFKNRHVYSLIIDLQAAQCVSSVFLGPTHHINIESPIASDNHDVLYVPYTVDDEELALHLAQQIPFRDGDDDAEWLRTVTDRAGELRRTLLHIVDLQSGEITGIITWQDDSLRVEKIPSGLLKPYLDDQWNAPIVPQYNASKGQLNICSRGDRSQAATTVASLYLPADRRPETSQFAFFFGKRRKNVITHSDQLVAVGSSAGVVSIFDVRQAVQSGHLKATDNSTQ